MTSFKISSSQDLSFFHRSLHLRSWILLFLSSVVLCYGKAINKCSGTFFFRQEKNIYYEYYIFI